MRFMFLSSLTGSSNNPVEAGYSLSIAAAGGTLGLIGDSLTSPCSFLTTGNGTLLVASGYGPMLRMRQNESHLSEGGVPAPRTAPQIAIDDGTGATTPLADDETIIVHFDYSQYGSLISNGPLIQGPSRNTENGKLSRAARQADYAKWRRATRLPNGGVVVGIVPLASDKNSLDPSGFINADIRAGHLFNDAIETKTGNSVYDNIKDEWKYLAFDLLCYTTSGYQNLLNNLLGITTSTTGTAPVQLRYECFMRYVDKDGNYSNPSPISNDAIITTEPFFKYTNLEVPTDGRITRRQIFRNINGSFDAFYLDIDTDDLTSTELISRNTDAQLKLGFGQPVWDDNGYNLFQLYGLPPTDKPYICEFVTRIFGAGFRIYTDGNVAVTNGSATITGIGTNWTPSFVGRQFIKNGTYTVIAVDPVNQTATIDKGYTSATNPYEDYSIQPFFGNSNLLQWSEAGLPESWPAANALELPDDDDEITGLITFANSLWILKNNSIYQFNTTIDPNRDGDYKPVSNRGCVNQRCAVQIQSVALMLDRTGIHVFRGFLPRSEYQVNSTPDHLSKPIGDLFRFEGSWLRLNWDADTRYWHAAHNKELTTVRWYVTMQGYRLPQHAICYDYLMDRWSVEEYPVPVSASCQSSVLLGKPILGGYGGKVYQPDRGPLDFINPDGTRLAVTGCIGGVLLQLSGTPPTCVGMPVAIVAGTGHGQQSLILSQSGAEIQVDQPFTIFPDDTSVIQIGAIKYYAQTGEFNYAKFDQLNPQAVSYLFRPTRTSLEAYISVLQDGEDLASNMVKGTWGCVSTDNDDPTMFKVTMTDLSGCAMVTLDAWRERDIPNRYSVQSKIEGFSGQEKPNINNVYIIGASQKQDLAV